MRQFSNATKKIGQVGMIVFTFMGRSVVRLTRLVKLPMKISKITSAKAWSNVFVPFYSRLRCRSLVNLTGLVKLPLKYLKQTPGKPCQM